MNPTPTGRVEDRNGTPALILTRTFTAPVEDVWAAITEPARLSRWIGTYTGDPATGTVMLTMTAEDDARPEPLNILECAPPHRLTAATPASETSPGWTYEVHLTESDGTTTLTFAQPGPHDLDTAGPGWEYYLDRLVAAEAGQDAAAINFDDYYPAMRDHYRP
ncbi:SRPBCC domain-containing protein [Agromyces humatus]|uniref:Activator of Hsp90 ATPase homologue 1/2-like C-terminal domain-containing protein n=1 Tax=Agromyces humatus TaxID=279573 RepID=A0ABP4X6F5_9MICO|nr:SRPBCC domain-containing protein [Agromyces humatus]